MSRTFEQITEEVLALPSEQRAQLVNTLSESLVEPKLSDAWRKVIRTRIDDLRSGRVQAIDEEEVNAQILKIVNGED